MVELISQIIVGIFASGLILFELLILFAKSQAIKFLRAFVKTPFHHFLEQTLRLIAGVSLVIAAPHMLYSNVFGVIGWLIIITSLILIGLPWRWHHKFAQKVIPLVIKFIHLYGLLCLILGAFILYSLLTHKF